MCYEQVSEQNCQSMQVDSDGRVHLQRQLRNIERLNSNPHEPALHSMIAISGSSKCEVGELRHSCSSPSATASRQLCSAQQHTPTHGTHRRSAPPFVRRQTATCAVLLVRRYMDRIRVSETCRSCAWQPRIASESVLASIQSLNLSPELMYGVCADMGAIFLMPD